ncbi:hypothetical protein R3P38DRAFT_2581118 [Favolaschia claudopus]|uniref:Uncharacterized protein n=1 Tax=Favolaschia claudopus TaxID=2862362 RepID=A0AAV9ZCH8_9AGAR
MDRGKDLYFDDHVGPLRQASVGWVWEAYSLLNNKDIIKKAFRLCKVREWDLSFECLTSVKIRARLRKEEEENTAFWQELQTNSKERIHQDLPSDDEAVAEDILPEIEAEENPDDSEISPRAVLADVSKRRRGRVARKADGGLRSTTQADDLDAETEPAEEAEGGTDGERETRGKRKTRPNQRYLGWIRHLDDVDSDVEEEDLDDEFVPDGGDDE